MQLSFAAFSSTKILLDPVITKLDWSVCFDAGVFGTWKHACDLPRLELISIFLLHALLVAVAVTVSHHADEFVVVQCSKFLASRTVWLVILEVLVVSHGILAIVNHPQTSVLRRRELVIPRIHAMVSTLVFFLAHPLQLLSCSGPIFASDFP